MEAIRRYIDASSLMSIIFSIAYPKFVWKIISQAHPFCMSNDILPDVR